MLLFLLFDIGGRGFLDRQDMVFLIKCVCGDVALEKDNDVRVAVAKINDGHESQFDRKTFLRFCQEHAAITAPLLELKRNLTKKIGGSSFWMKHIELRHIKMVEKFEDDSFDFDDFLLDETCIIRFFSELGEPLPHLMSSRFDEMRARYEAEHGLQKDERKKKKKVVKTADTQSGVLGLIAPLKRRLTNTVENITGNKYARVLAHDTKNAPTGHRFAVDAPQAKQHPSGGAHSHSHSHSREKQQPAAAAKSGHGPVRHNNLVQRLSLLVTKTAKGTGPKTAKVAGFDNIGEGADNPAPATPSEEPAVTQLERIAKSDHKDHNRHHNHHHHHHHNQHDGQHDGQRQKSGHTQAGKPKARNMVKRLSDAFIGLSGARKNNYQVAPE